MKQKNIRKRKPHTSEQIFVECAKEILACLVIGGVLAALFAIGLSKPIDQQYKAATETRMEQATVTGEHYEVVNSVTRKN